MSVLEGRTALVTGGSRGIGAATVRTLAAEGARVVVVARDRDRVDRLAADVGGEAVGLTCDVSSASEVERLAREVAGRVGEVDVLVNNAGISGSAPVHRQSLEEWDRMFAVNVRGVFLLTRAFLPGMAEREWGRVVNVASVAGLHGGRYIAAYAASKHAVLGFTRSVAAEVAARGVTVNAVCPGYVDTPMTDGSIQRIVEKTGKSAEEARAAILATTPQKRLVEPEEVAFAVLTLCRHEARGINGETIVIDGGASAAR